MYKNKENLIDQNIEMKLYDAFCKGIQMISPFKNDLLYDNQKNYILSVFKDRISIDDLNDPKALLSKLENCLIEIYSIDENNTFNLNKPPRIICPEKNSDKFKNLLNRIIKELNDSVKINEEIGRNKKSLNTMPNNILQNCNDILTCDYISGEDTFSYVIKIKDSYKNVVPKSYHEISNALGSEDECRLEAEKIVGYLKRILTWSKVEDIERWLKLLNAA